MEPGDGMLRRFPTAVKTATPGEWPNRLKGRFGYPEDNPFRVTFHPDRIDRPTRWIRSRRIFVCSMGDLFHKDVRPEHIDRVFEVMTRDAPHLIYMILTKTAGADHRRANGIRNWKNIWLGV